MLNLNVSAILGRIPLLKLPFGVTTRRFGRYKLPRIHWICWGKLLFVIPHSWVRLASLADRKTLGCWVHLAFEPTSVFHSLLFLMVMANSLLARAWAAASRTSVRLRSQSVWAANPAMCIRVFDGWDGWDCCTWSDPCATYYLIEYMITQNDSDQFTVDKSSKMSRM